MDVKALKTFQSIVNYGSFNRAAEEMNYAQSTVTMQIQKLESDLGVQLIERGKNKLRLTEAGRLFYDQSLQIIRDMEQLQTNLSDLHAGDAGDIRLGLTEPTASYRLPGLLAKFQDRYPRIRVAVEIASTPALSERVLRGELDFAFCSAPELGSGLYFEPLIKEEFVVLLPERHELADKASIAPEDIPGHRLLVTSATCPYRKKLQSVLQESGSVRLDTMEVGSMMALPYYVQSGLGVALVPGIILNPIPSGTVMRPLNTVIDMTCGLLGKSPESPLKRAGLKLYQFLKQELRPQGGDV